MSGRRNILAQQHILATCSIKMSCKRMLQTSMHVHPQMGWAIIIPTVLFVWPLPGLLRKLKCRYCMLALWRSVGSKSKLQLHINTIYNRHMWHTILHHATPFDTHLRVLSTPKREKHLRYSHYHLLGIVKSTQVTGAVMDYLLRKLMVLEGMSSNQLQLSPIQ